jgi:hypothetical protein
MKQSKTQPLPRAKEAYIAPVVESETITIESGFAHSPDPQATHSANYGYDYFDENGDY